MVDDYATLLDTGSPVSYDVASATRDSPTLQAVLLARLRAGDAVILPSWLAQAGLDAVTQRYLIINFEQVGGDGDLAVWVRRAPGDVVTQG